MKVVDQVFGWLLVVSSLLHAVGSYTGYKNQPKVLLWALSATLAGLLLASINLVRVGQPELLSLAWISAFGCLWWMVQALVFGKLLGNIFDFRALIHFVIALVLFAFSLRSALGFASR